MAVVKTKLGRVFSFKTFIYCLIATGCIAVGYFTLTQSWSFLFGDENKQNGLFDHIIYNSKALEMDNKKQEIRIFELEPKKGLTVKPVLAQDSIFGFETTGSMIARNGGIAGVNGGFFHAYGQPSGLVVVDGKLLSSTLGEYPVLGCSSDGEFWLEHVSAKMTISIGGTELKIDAVNRQPQENEAILFTQEYGTDNRFEEQCVNICISDDIVKSIDATSLPARIFENSIMITLTGDRMALAAEIRTGVKAEQHVEFYPQTLNVQNAYECGSWLVKDGKVVIKEKDKWVGLTTNRDPRTAIGIKANGTLIAVVVDGRQPGYSEGMTGRELGEFMISEGAINAAMLDGGASSTMIFNNSVVNKPSFIGRERIIGGALAVVPNT